MGDYRKLAVWRKADALSEDVFRILSRTREPRHSGLRAQLVRSADSIATNIVEGSAFKSDADFARFVSMSIASCTETEYSLHKARRRQLIRQSEFDHLTNRLGEVRKMLHGLHRYLVKESGQSDRARRPRRSCRSTECSRGDTTSKRQSADSVGESDSRPRLVTGD